MRLLDKRYEEIKRIVVSLFTELNLYNVPVDCFKICELLGLRVIKYSEVKEQKRKACKEFSKDGFFLKRKRMVKVFLKFTMMIPCMIVG